MNNSNALNDDPAPLHARMATVTGTPDRREPRVPIKLDAKLRRREGKGVVVTVVDLSVHGFKAAAHGLFPAGSQVWVKFPNLETLYARVAWADHLEMGCEFINPLHAAVVDGIVRNSQR